MLAPQVRELIRTLPGKCFVRKLRGLEMSESLVRNLLGSAIDVRGDDGRRYATVGIDVDAELNVSHQAVGRPRFIEREVEDVGETGGRGAAGFQTTRAH